MAGFSRFGASRVRLQSKYLHGVCVTDRGAFPLGETVTFRIGVPDTAKTAVMKITNDGTGETSCRPMEKEEGRFALSLPMSDLAKGRTDLFFYKFTVETDKGFFDLCRNSYDFSEKFTEASDKKGTFQLLVYEKNEVQPDFLKGGCLYQIFPDRFYRGGDNPMKKDAVLCTDRLDFPNHMRVKKENDKNNLFYGGDLQGIVKKLDYLLELGVTALYLNPIFESPSNHRYNTADYSKIDVMLGGEDAFKTLLLEAKKRGIAVILDGVFNHTGSDSVYFNAKNTYDTVGAYQSKDSPYADWYNFKTHPDTYESWWGIATLPRVKCDEPSYRKFLFGENGIVRKYTRMGIDGWRLDVADELSDNFLMEFRKTVKEENPHAVIIGEVWEDATTKISYGIRKRYFQGAELDSVMNYPLQKAIVSYLAKGSFAKFMHSAMGIYENYPPENANLLMNILGTHDTERILTVLGDTEAPTLPYEKRAGHTMTEKMRKTALARLRLAVAMQMTVPGVPCIYYGDEAGMEGLGDPFSRLPYPWGEENKNLQQFYRKMIAMRKKEPIFLDGSFHFVYADIDILCYERQKNDEKIVVLINRSEREYECSMQAISLMTGETADTFLLHKNDFLLLKTKGNPDYQVYVKVELPKDEL